MLRATLSVDDIVERATRAALLLLANGATVIRTDVDVAPNIGLRAVEALATVREALAGRLDLQVGALVAPPVGGPEGAEQRARLREAMDAGADVVGGCPHIDPDPSGRLEACFQVATDTGRPIDLHTDETLDPQRLDLRDFTASVQHSGFDRGATASHCVSLGMLAPADAGRHRCRGGRSRRGRGDPPADQPVPPGPRPATGTPRGLTASAAVARRGRDRGRGW